MLGNAGETELDLRFRLLGIPVRVHPLFWLAGAILWWNPDRLDLTFVGILCVFISILVHELGHAVMYRRYGHRSQIVLYLMGGYATGAALSTWKNVIVSAAGPGAGFVLFGIVCIVEMFIPLEVFRQHDTLFFCIYALKFINLWWGLLNLTPCLPLDGGHIMEALMHRYSPMRSTVKVLWVSILSSGAVALWAAQNQHRYMMFLFGILCAQSVISLNHFKTFR